MKDNLNRKTRRFEAVCLALAGKTYNEIACKLRVSPMRAQSMIEQQAGRDFFPQLVLERRKYEARYLGFGNINERKYQPLGRQE
jgi:hypothetical protein